MNTTHTASTPNAGDSWTVGRVLAWVTEDFAARGLDTPRLEAELLLCHALGCNRIQLIIDRDRPLIPDELATYRGLVARRRNREPVAYLRGEREFFGHRFLVDRRVLVPRPDTETLVEVALERTRDRNMFGRLLDVCTGSGNVALSFAKQRPTWRVIATDVSPEAIEVASHNAVRLGLAWSVSFATGDLFAPVAAEPSFDLITANPPYIPTREIEELAADIRDHEPRLALDGGEDGLSVVRRLVEEAPRHLVAGGLLALEIGSDQGQAVRDLMLRSGWGDVGVKQDLGQRDRIVSGIRR
jgi:release factor glutamine methyltransferase